MEVNKKGTWRMLGVGQAGRYKMKLDIEAIAGLC